MLMLKLVSTLSVSIMGLKLEGPLGIRQCQEKCRQLGGCVSVDFNPNLLQCKVNMKMTEQIATSKLSRHWNVTRAGKHSGVCKSRETRIGKLKNHCVPVGKRHPRLQKGNYAEPSFRGNKKNRCISNGCEPTEKSPSKVDDCIVFLKENFTIDANKTLFELPVNVKPGMKISVYGRYVPGTTYSQLSFTKDPADVGNLFKWINVFAKWSKNQHLVIARGLKRTDLNGTFPISDPTHFDVTVQLSSLSTKIYVDKTLVWTLKAIPYLKHLCLRRYEMVHRMIVLKTEDECERGDHTMKHWCCQG